MGELGKFLRDWRFLTPLLMLLGLEALMQSGIYARILEPNSYAASIRHIIRTVRESPLRPNVLIIGTSVAYQGILLPQLNEQLAGSGLRVQSVACQGCMLETQQRLYRELHDQFPELKAVVHSGETALAWKARYTVDVANRGMLAQFSRRETLQLLQEQEFELGAWDFAFYYIGLLSYQSDMRDLALAPLTRIKSLSRFERHRRADFPYVNEYQFDLSIFEARSLQECLEHIPQMQAELIAAGKTDRHHANSALQTCQIAAYEQSLPESGAPQWNALFFRRLQRFYDEIHADGRMVITLLPPYSNLVSHLNGDDRMALWRRETTRIEEGRRYALVDLRHALDGPQNAAYYYDLLHLNARGAQVWTTSVAAELRRLAPQILAGR
ncbi:MAG: hypothetical protein K1X75_10875 [Leptospirales bacterium]|nr:hypothetical protein [Leptospirales bacterium]